MGKAETGKERKEGGELMKTKTKKNELPVMSMVYGDKTTCDTSGAGRG
jgi:hypothetical protein